MHGKSSYRMLVVAALIAAAPLLAHAQKMADGNDWKNSSDLERRAYLVGVGNMLAAGNGYDAKRLPGQEDSFSRTAMRGARGTTIPEAMERIDVWYRANPDKLNRPVLAVLWSEIVKPGLARKN
jgi:hypothetical protein